MTRKDYTKIAEILKSHNFVDDNLIDSFCDFFKSDNPRFDRERFRNAIINED